MLQGTLGYPGGVVVHAENKRGNREDVAVRKPLKHCRIFAGLIEALVHVFQVGRIDGLHADKDPLATRGGDQVDEFLVAQQVGADLRHPMHLGLGSNNVAQQRLGAFDVDSEIVVDEKHRDLATLFFGSRFQHQ